MIVPRTEGVGQIHFDDKDYEFRVNGFGRNCFNAIIMV